MCAMMLNRTTLAKDVFPSPWQRAPDNAICHGDSLITPEQMCGWKPDFDHYGVLGQQAVLPPETSSSCRLASSCV
jgi:hypothetical protein